MTYYQPPQEPPPDPFAPVPYHAGAHPYRAPKSSGAAVALELVPGLFGVFGIGNIYAGRVATGVILMVGFWVLFWINILLIFLVIGYVTMPLTWIGFLIAGIVSATRAVERHNAGW